MICSLEQFSLSYYVYYTHSKTVFFKRYLLLDLDISMFINTSFVP